MATSSPFALVNDRSAHARVTLVHTSLFIPRGLVMLTALWVFLSWIWLFGFSPPVQAQAASYAPSIQVLFASIGIGISIGWPLLRLSGRPSRAPMMQCLYDALSVFVILQVVIWPLRLVTTWTLPRTAAVDAALALSVATTAAGLSLITARSNERARTAAMSVFAIAALLAPALSLLGTFERVPLLTALSTPALLATLASPTPLDPTDVELQLLRFAAQIAAIALLASGVGCLWRRSRTAREARAAVDSTEPL